MTFRQGWECENCPACGKDLTKVPRQERVRQRYCDQECQDEYVARSRPKPNTHERLAARRQRRKSVGA